MNQYPQYPLALHLRETADLDRYYPGPNAELLAAVRCLACGAEPARLLIRGGRGSGRTHLLQGAARLATASGRQAIYLPLSEVGADPLWLQGLESVDLVCVDDHESVAAHRQWSIALVRLLDSRRRDGGALLLTAGEAADQAGQALPDLRTRLTAMASYALKPMDDVDRQELLRRRAAARGLILGDGAAEFLIRRLPRDAGSLLQALEILDRAALSAGRRLTLPFVQSQWPFLAPPNEQTSAD